MLQIKGTFGYGSLTATAGTAITRLIPPRKKLRAVISNIVYICGTTAHAVNLIRPFGNTTVAAVAAGGQTAITLTVDPGAAIPNGISGKQGLTAASITAANDYLVFETAGGEFYYGSVASVAAGAIAGQLTVTMNANLPTGGIAAGAVAWLHKASGGSDPFTGLVQESYNFPLSATTTLVDVASGVFSAGVYQPILIYDANATAAGTLFAVSGSYVSGDIAQ